MLVESGVLFSEMYACCDESGKVIRNDRLDRIPLWNQALAFAKQEMSGGVSGDAIGLVAGRSAEFDAVNQALHDGSSLKNLVCGPPVFAWGEFHNSVASGPAAKSSRRWWQLWETEEVYTLTRGQRTVARVTAIVAILIALAGVGGVVYLLITFLKATN
jgi:hypothetical protein